MRVGRRGSSAGGGVPGSPPRSVVLRKVSSAVVVVVVAAAIAGGIGYVILKKPAPTATPQSLANAALSDYKAGNLTALCGLVAPDAQSQCNSAVQALSGYKITTRNFALGTLTENSSGTEAVVVLTGTVCVSATASGSTQQQCNSNTDPNVDLDTQLTFDQIYAKATAGASTTSAEFTLPLLRQNGKWYIAVA